MMGRLTEMTGARTGRGKGGEGLVRGLGVRVTLESRTHNKVEF